MIDVVGPTAKLKVAGSSHARINDCKTLTVVTAVNGRAYC